MLSSLWHQQSPKWWPRLWTFIACPFQGIVLCSPDPFKCFTTAWIISCFFSSFFSLYLGIRCTQIPAHHRLNLSLLSFESVLLDARTLYDRLSTCLQTPPGDLAPVPSTSDCNTNSSLLWKIYNPRSYVQQRALELPLYLVTGTIRTRYLDTAFIIRPEAGAARACCPYPLHQYPFQPFP